MMGSVAPTIVMNLLKRKKEEEEKRERDRQERERLFGEAFKKSVEDKDRYVKTSDGKVRRRYRWDEV